MAPPALWRKHRARAAGERGGAQSGAPGRLGRRGCCWPAPGQHRGQCTKTRKAKLRSRASQPRGWRSVLSLSSSAMASCRSRSAAGSARCEVSRRYLVRSSASRSSTGRRSHAVSVSHRRSCSCGSGRDDGAPSSRWRSLARQRGRSRPSFRRGSPVRVMVRRCLFRTFSCSPDVPCAGTVPGARSRAASVFYPRSWVVNPPERRTCWIRAKVLPWCSRGSSAGMKIFRGGSV